MEEVGEKPGNNGEKPLHQNHIILLKGHNTPI